MLCVYSYMSCLNRTVEVHGNFQVDTADFKAFFRKCQPFIAMCYVKCEDGQNWVYTQEFGWEPMSDAAQVRYGKYLDMLGYDDYLNDFDLF